jgi:hypothetical protein
MQDRYEMFILLRQRVSFASFGQLLVATCGLGSLGAFNWKEDSHTNLAGVDIGCLFLVNCTLPAYLQHFPNLITTVLR